MDLFDYIHDRTTCKITKEKIHNFMTLIFEINDDLVKEIESNY
jgi:hypothetical protein